MRVSLHVRASQEGRKVRTHKISDTYGEGLVFQFLASDEEMTMQAALTQDPDGVSAALAQLYRDAVEIYDRARREVTIERKDGVRVPYVPVRYKQAIDKGYAENGLVPAIARIVRKPTLGFGHLAEQRRPDLMLEQLILDTTKPYHHLFSARTIELARERMEDYRRHHADA